MRSGEALYYLLLSGGSVIAIITGWRLARELVWLFRSTPKADRDWWGVLLVLGLFLVGLMIGVGPGPSNLPIGRAVRDFIGVE